MHVPNLFNLRELGGQPLAAGGTTRLKAFLRSDTLTRLTPEGMQQLVDYGLRTIIDLRWPEEVKAEPYDHLLEGYGLTRIHRSLLDENLAAWRARKVPLDPKDQINLHVMEYARPQIHDVLLAIAQAQPGTVLFHCHSGKDRTGLIATLLLALADVELGAMVEDYTLSEERLRDGYLADRTDLSPEEIQKRLHCPPQQVSNTLDYLDTQYGGVGGYMKSLGLSKDECKLINQRLVPIDPSINFHHSDRKQ